jgi:photosystem II stability/assembly factor-like uncharacterized protein
MKHFFLILFLLSTTLLSAQWPLYDIGTTLELGGVHVKADGTILLSGGMGMIKKSSDCGASWTDIVTGYTDDLSEFQFVNDMVGYVIADDGQYGKTIDGGETWSFYSTPAPDDLRALYFLDEQNGYFVGKEGGIIHTTNGGTTWTLMTSGTTNRLQGVYFTDELNGIVTGRNSTLLHTSNGGQTWSSVSGGVNGDLGNIAFSDASNGTICGEGGVYKVNADLSMIEFMSLGVLFEFSDVLFLNENVGWLCGEPGAVFVTNSGGDSWIEIALDGDPFALSSIHGTSLNSVFTVGEFGKVNGLCTSATSISEYDRADVIESLTINNSELLIQLGESVSHQSMNITLTTLSGAVTDEVRISGQSDMIVSIPRPATTGLYLLTVNGEEFVASKKIIIQ